MVRGLNGWQRLWVVLSVLYLLVVVGFAALLWPTAAGTWHRKEFIKRMPGELQAHVDGAYESKSSWEEAWKKRVIPETNKPQTGRKAPAAVSKSQTDKNAGLPPGFVLVSEPVTFPNGAVLDIRVAKEGDTVPDARVGPAYWAVVEREASAARRTMVWQTALVWFIPCLTLYVFGSAVAWVRRGFQGAALPPRR